MGFSLGLSLGQVKLMCAQPIGLMNTIEINMLQHHHVYAKLPVSIYRLYVVA